MSDTKMQMFEVPGSPWVIARDIEEARRLVREAGLDCPYSDRREWRVMPPDESFPMMYDGVPDNADTGPCEHGCDEEAPDFDGHNHVTLTVAQWCEKHPNGYVIQEFSP